MSVPPPSFEKAVADRLSALPPKGHDVKGSSSSTSSHGCEFIFLFPILFEISIKYGFLLNYTLLQPVSPYLEL